jgi:hypothetical protein
MAYNDKERAEILAAARLINRYLDAPTGSIPEKVAKAVLEAPVPRKGGNRTGDTTLGNTLSYLDANLDAVKVVK